jgi:1-aminocyclopropane-1-carboxylate deaminase/D-cysteine desulfhydrase-like pyridoxal-dependent ACC family enzyme
MPLFRQHTPIESYLVNGRQVNVKRDDLYGVSPAPPLAKLRGMRVLLRRLYDDGVRLTGCWDTRVSKLGLGLAACCRELPEMKCIVSYPTRKGEPEPAAISKARELGAEVYAMKGSRISICFAKARTYVTEKGGSMLPFGLECSEAVDGVAQEAATVPRGKIKGGTVVISCGSGVTLAGLLSGLPIFPDRLIGLSSGRSVNNILSCVRRYVKEIPSCLEIHEALVPYSRPLDYSCPFPSHPNYDLKAWKFLEDNLQNFTDPVLFWNIGA